MGEWVGKRERETDEKKSEIKDRETERQRHREIERKNPTSHIDRKSVV